MTDPRPEPAAGTPTRRAVLGALVVAGTLVPGRVAGTHDGQDGGASAGSTVDGTDRAAEVGAVPGSLDRLVHRPARLRILARLYRHREASVRELAAATDGHGGRDHLHALAVAGAVEMDPDSGPEGGSACRLTDEGRTRFEAYGRTLAPLFDAVE